MIFVAEIIPILIAGSGLCCAILYIAVLKEVRPGLGMMLDLWVAAGLLRLSTNLSWEPLASSAALIATRKLIMLSWEVGESTGESLRRT